MLEFNFSAAGVAETRLALSPLWELVCSLRVLGATAVDVTYRPWIDEVRPRIRGLSDLALLQALVPSGNYLPDFLTPPPSTPVPDVEAEIAGLQQATPAQVRRDLACAYPKGLPEVLRPVARDPEGGLRRIGDALHEYWISALAESWPQLRGVLQSDIVYRAREFAMGGASRLFRELHPTVTWSGKRLLVDKSCVRRLDLGGAGLLLVPSAFAWPTTLTITDAPLRPTLIYPARGVATMWGGPVRTAATAGLARMIGTKRAALLAMLGAPASTTELARRAAMTAGGVSQHLSVLREAGLVEGSRSGRMVLYTRTSLGETLAASLV